MILVLCLWGTGGAIEWHGTITQAAVQTQSDSTASSTLDGQYLLNASGRPVPALQYLASLRYRRLQTTRSDNSQSWLTEVNPTAFLTWNVPLLKIYGDYSFRDTQGKEQVQQSTSRSAGITAQTTWGSLPRLRGRYDWLQNLNDLDLLGRETRQRNWTGAADYTGKHSTLRYEYVDREIRNPVTRLKQVSRRHVGRLESALALWNRGLSVQSSYQVVSKSEKERRAGEEDILISLTPVLGLYAIDPTPGFGVLEVQAGLIDGNLDSAASYLMDLSRVDVHNFGLDFGTPSTVDHLFLYTDTLSNPLLRWAIYTSSDNLTWELVRDYAADPFSVAFRRYEVSFSRQTTRHIKLVLEPQPLERPVYVTELRALITREEAKETNWATDHNASLRLAAQPASWLGASIEGSLLRSSPSPISLARQQDGMAAALNLRPGPTVRLNGRYQFNRTDYPDRPDTRTHTENLLFTWAADWTSRLRSTTSVSRQTESYGGNRSRRLYSATARVDARFLPSLRGATDAGYSEDHRFLAADVFETRYIGQAVEADPLTSLRVEMDYRIFDLRARHAQIPNRRESTTLRGTLSITPAIFVRGEGYILREAGRTDATWNSAVNWTATPKLTLTTGADRSIPSQGSRTLLLYLQGSFRWTVRTSVQAGYSHLRSDEPQPERVSNLRLGISTTF